MYIQPLWLLLYTQQTKEHTSTMQRCIIDHACCVVKYYITCTVYTVQSCGLHRLRPLTFVTGTLLCMRETTWQAVLNTVFCQPISIMALPKSFLQGLSRHNAAQVISRAATVYMKVSRTQGHCAPSNSLSHWTVRQYSTLYKRSLLMKQFDQIKSQHPNYILLFQVGDFYELYGDDASKSNGSCSASLLAYFKGSPSSPALNIMLAWKIMLLLMLVLSIASRPDPLSYAHTRARTHTRTHTHTHARTHALTHTHTHTHTHTPIHNTKHQNEAGIEKGTPPIIVYIGEVTAKTSLRLTRNKANLFMAGFPTKNLSEWQRVLVEAGFQLAICDQFPPKYVKNISIYYNSSLKWILIIFRLNKIFKTIVALKRT